MSVIAGETDRPVNRFEISQCIGCGSMQVDETCEVCDYERLELIDSSEYDALATLLDVGHAESARCSAIIAEFADGRLSCAEAGAQLRAVSHAEALSDAEAFSAPVEDSPITIWRCRNCGAIDAMQECLGICIWRTFGWVRAEEVQRLRSELDALNAQRQAQTKLRTQLLHSRPRSGHELEHNQALQGAARALLIP